MKRASRYLVSLVLFAGCSDSGTSSESTSARAPAPVTEQTPPMPTTVAIEASLPTPSRPQEATTTTASNAPFTTAAPVPEFQESACQPVASVPERVTCGFLDVPERHENPTGRRIRMAVAIVEPAQPDPAASPLVFLAGGPGYGSISATEIFLEKPPAPRTMVLIDYRGVGRSEPSLACHEFDEFETRRDIPADDPAVVERDEAALLACRERLVQEGVDLAAYNYTEIAADLAELRVALGYAEWDLFGLSNGGRVALEVARRHPKGVRALILDAASPPQENLPGLLWPHGQRAFEALFDGCAADPACHQAFPNLRESFERLSVEWRESPPTVSVPKPDGSVVPVTFTDALGLNLLRNAMYDTDLIPVLPFYIDELANGREYETVAQLVVAPTGPSTGFSLGMFLSVNCQEEVAFLPDGYFREQAAQYPHLAAVITTNRIVEECAIWDVGQADQIIDQPVQSDIPALLLVGQYDPVHPRSSAEAIASGLPNSTVVEIPGLGHGTVGVHPCPTSLLAAFVADPAAPVDVACVAAMPAPEWLLP
jgi:pimeloyl-ACP methyl ester carboxylesterase